MTELEVGGMISLEVDGRPVQVAPGSTLLEACRAVGVDVPTLCWDPRLSPVRLLSRAVSSGVEGARGPWRRARPRQRRGMRVDTTDRGARHAARGVLELIVVAAARARAGHPRRAQRARAGLRTPRRRPQPAFAAPATTAGRRLRHPYIKLDRDLCIACARCVRMCDEVQGTFALDDGRRAAPTPSSRRARAARGASRTAWRAAAASTSAPPARCRSRACSTCGRSSARRTTTCGYCGVGCTLDVHTRDDGVARDQPGRDGPGQPRPRLRQGPLRARLRPLARPADHARWCAATARWSRRSWDEALGRRRGRASPHPRRARARRDRGDLLRARDQRGELPDAEADAGRDRHQQRRQLLAHLPRAVGRRPDRGVRARRAAPTRSTTSTAPDVLPARRRQPDRGPPGGRRADQAARCSRGARLVVVDPRRTELAGYADVHLRPRPGHQRRRLQRPRRRADRRGPGRRARSSPSAPTDSTALRELLADYPPERVEEISRRPGRRPAPGGARSTASADAPGDRLRARRHRARARHRRRAQRSRNLAILTGSVGTDDGCGVNPLRGQNNVQGASDMGALPDLLPGYQKVADDEVASASSAPGACRSAASAGLRIPEMFDAAVDGRLKALYRLRRGHRPDRPRLRRTSGRRSRPASWSSRRRSSSPRRPQLADVVLPAALLPREGRHVRQLRPPRSSACGPALAPPGRGAHRLRDHPRASARALGVDLGCPTPAAALDEMRAR